jgi:hypothetical protein
MQPCHPTPSITSASIHTNFILIVSGDEHATLLIVSLLPSLFSTSYYLVSGNTHSDNKFSEEISDLLTCLLRINGCGRKMNFYYHYLSIYYKSSTKKRREKSTMSGVVCSSSETTSTKLCHTLTNRGRRSRMISMPREINILWEDLQVSRSAREISSRAENNICANEPS